MSQRVLVPIKSCDQIEELLPHLEEIARPGMTIIFLVPLGANRFAQLAGRLLEIQSGLPASFSIDGGTQHSYLKHQIENSSQAQLDCGARIEVKFYSGRLNPILRQCIANGSYRTMVMRSAVIRPRGWFEIILSTLRKGGSPRALPVLQCYPGNHSGR